MCFSSFSSPPPASCAPLARKYLGLTNPTRCRRHPSNHRPTPPVPFILYFRSDSLQPFCPISIFSIWDPLNSPSNRDNCFLILHLSTPSSSSLADRGGNSRRDQKGPAKGSAAPPAEESRISTANPARNVTFATPRAVAKPLGWSRREELQTDDAAEKPKSNLEFREMFLKK